MQNLEHYNREMKQIARAADLQRGVIAGGTMAWAMMIVGVAVTGTMTYSLTREGMESSSLWKAWVDFAAFLPVTLLEGSALALAYGRHYWFRSSEQRSIANVAGWAVWIILAATSLVHFAARATGNQSVKSAMGVYASYILPLTIVAVPMLWKKLYDAAPESAMRIAVLEAEACLRSQLVEIQKEQNALMIQAYRDGMSTPRVSAARKALFEQASIEHAQQIVGFIEGTGERTEDPKPRVIWQGANTMENSRPN